MEITDNPFIVSGSIDPEYFCDRRDEFARLLKSLANGNNPECGYAASTEIPAIN